MNRTFQEGVKADADVEMIAVNSSTLSQVDDFAGIDVSGFVVMNEDVVDFDVTVEHPRLLLGIYGIDNVNEYL